MNKNRFFFFQTADNDCMAVAVSQIRSIENDGDGSVHVSFENAGAAGGVIGVAEMTVTDGKEDDVVKEIARLCAEGNKSVITIADDVKSQYCHADITALGTITPGS